jgi:hypothetical protein
MRGQRSKHVPKEMRKADVAVLPAHGQDLDLRMGKNVGHKVLRLLLVFGSDPARSLPRAEVHPFDAARLEIEMGSRAEASPPAGGRNGFVRRPDQAIHVANMWTDVYAVQPVVECLVDRAGIALDLPEQTWRHELEEVVVRSKAGDVEAPRRVEAVWGEVLERVVQYQAEKFWRLQRASCCVVSRGQRLARSNNATMASRLSRMATGFYK